MTPFKGQKGEAYEGGYRAPAVDPLAGSHQARARCSQRCSPPSTGCRRFVEIAGGPKGDGLKQQIEAGHVPGHREDHVRWRQPDRLSDRPVPELGARRLLLLLGRNALRGPLQELEDVLHHVAAGADGWILPLIPFHFTLVQNIRRDPFEQAVGIDQKSAMSHRGRTWRSGDSLPVRLEHAADRPAAMAAVVRDAQGVSATAGAGELQPHAGDGSNQERRRPREPVVHDANTTWPVRTSLRKGRPLCTRVTGTVQKAVLHQRQLSRQHLDENAGTRIAPSLPA